MIAERITSRVNGRAVRVTCALHDDRRSYGHDRAPVVIYALGDPRTGEIRYVGQTCYPKRRLRGHVGRPCSTTRPWIEELRSLGLRPRMTFLERTLGATARQLEREYIHTIRASGDRLLNVR